MYIIYGKTRCQFCTNALTLLQSRGISFTYYSMDGKTAELLELATKYKHMTVPIVIKVEDSENHFIGGYSELKAELESSMQK